MAARMAAVGRTSGEVQMSTRQSAAVRMSSHRWPGNSLVTTTRRRPSGWWMRHSYAFMVTSLFGFVGQVLWCPTRAPGSMRGAAGMMGRESRGKRMTLSEADETTGVLLIRVIPREERRPLAAPFSPHTLISVSIRLRPPPRYGARTDRICPAGPDRVRIRQRYPGPRCAAWVAAGFPPGVPPRHCPARRR